MLCTAAFAAFIVATTIPVEGIWAGLSIAPINLATVTASAKVDHSRFPAGVDLAGEAPVSETVKRFPTPISLW